MARIKKKQIVQIRLSGMADKGKSIGRDENGEVYFIEGAVPGDLVNALIIRKRKGVKMGIVQEIIEPSPDRATPFCQHFKLCGGCKWQNLSYQRQLDEKQKIVDDNIRRIGNIHSAKALEIKGAHSNREYRNKLEYTFSTRRWVPQEEIDTQEEVSFGPAAGFHRAGSFDKVVEVETCHLQMPLGNEIRDYIRDFATDNKMPFYNIRENHGVLRNLVIRNNRKGQWMVNLIVGELHLELENLLNGLKEKFSDISSLHYTLNKKKNDSIHDLRVTHFAGEQHLYESIGDVNFMIGPKSFFQTNVYQAEELYACALEFAELKGHENVYDLYTGLGSIALYLAKHCKKIVGIEEIAEAIEDANENKKLNNIDNAEFYSGDVKDILNVEFLERHGRPDIVVTDPPRAGMHKDVINTLLSLKAKKIVYVSCNPATQARDLSLLSERYELIKYRPVDMFPHTSHIENVALLKLKNEES